MSKMIVLTIVALFIQFIVVASLAWGLLFFIQHAPELGFLKKTGAVAATIKEDFSKGYHNE